MLHNMSNTTRDADYFTQRYGLTATHSEVLEASKSIAPCKTLDLGCGRGRNAIYLGGLGFDVTAVAANPSDVQTLDAIIAADGNDNVDNAPMYINQADMHHCY